MTNRKIFLEKKYSGIFGRKFTWTIDSKFRFVHYDLLPVLSAYKLYALKDHQSMARWIISAQWGKFANESTL